MEHLIKDEHLRNKKKCQQIQKDVPRPRQIWKSRSDGPIHSHANWIQCFHERTLWLAENILWIYFHRWELESYWLFGGEVGGSIADDPSNVPSWLRGYQDRVTKGIEASLRCSSEPLAVIRALARNACYSAVSLVILIRAKRSRLYMGPIKHEKSVEGFAALPYGDTATLPVMGECHLSN